VYAYAVASAGESFLSPDGVEWTDFQNFPDSSGTDNVCIKAYTRYGADGPQTPISVWVDGGADPSLADGTEAHPYPTISEAFLHVVEGDSVRVRPGVYNGTLRCPTTRLNIVSTDGASATILDAGGNGSCFEADNNIATRLVGFTLRGGAMTQSYGGGAYCGVLDHCVISNCTAQSGGGAASCDLINCLVTGNTASWNGGGVYECNLLNCTLAGNLASRYGGGAYLNQALAVNTIVATNISSRGYAYGNDVYGNGYYTMINTSSDVDVKFADVARGDFRLSIDSPCIDAGDNSFVESETDLDGKTRIVGRSVDRGAFERELSAPGWTDPGVTAEDTVESEAEKVSAAMVTEGFREDTSAAVTTLPQYVKIADWTEQKGVDKADLAASSLPLTSVALGVDEPVSYETNDLKVVTLDQTSGGFSFQLSVPDYQLSRVNVAMLASAVELVGATTVTGDYEVVSSQLQVYAGEQGIGVSVTPPTDGTNGFYKVNLK